MKRGVFFPKSMPQGLNGSGKVPVRDKMLPQRLKPSYFKAFAYGLKAVPFRKMSFSAACKAHCSCFLKYGLKPVPFTP
jgi:hypothetical protein